MQKALNLQLLSCKMNWTIEQQYQLYLINGNFGFGKLWSGLTMTKDVQCLHFVMLRP